MFTNKNQRHRHSIRLKEYDYSSPGIYFVTICVDGREYLFGDIKNGEMILNELGKIVKNQWENIVNRYNNISLDAYMIMPNHLHGIITVGAPLAGARTPTDAGTPTTPTAGATPLRAGARPAPTLGDIIGSFKSLCVHDWLEYIKNNNIDARGKFWQRNYYEHIIRDERALNNVQRYIVYNPINWENDLENNKLIGRLTKEEYNKKLKEFTEGIYI